MNCSKSARQCAFFVRPSLLCSKVLMNPYLLSETRFISGYLQSSPMIELPKLIMIYCKLQYDALRPGKQIARR